MKMSRRARKLLDGFAPVWERLGECLRRRPLFVLTLIISSLVLLFVTLTFINTASEVSRVSDAFCNKPVEDFTDKQRRNCQQLFDKMLADPTPTQRARLKEIVGVK
jgi:hypothetical protein